MDRAKTRKLKDRLDRVIGNNIRVERELRNMTRDELAEMLDLTISHMGLIERGGRGTTAVTLEKLTRVFGISIDSLFAEADKKSLSVREDSNSELAGNRRKITTLITRLNEQETDFVIHVIKGIISHHPVHSTNPPDENE